MRKSVLTGLFACGLILSISTTSASAESFDSIVLSNKQDQKTTVLDLLVFSGSNATTSVYVAKPETAPAEPTPVAPLVVMHHVAEGESLSDIAKQYNTDWKRLYDKNLTIIDPDVISVGLEITIPAADEVLTSRELPQTEPVVQEIVRTTVAPVDRASAQPKTQERVETPASINSTNGYIAGYCTWYVKNKRSDLPNNLGNASTWVSRAAKQGIATGSSPAVGAVGQRGNHVVYVESVNDDGTVTISEMNHKGRYVTTTRTLPADYFSYIY